MKQPFRKSVNFNKFLKKCPCYYALIIFSSRHILDIYHVRKIELVCLYICGHLSVFPNSSVRMYALELKIGMLSLSREKYFSKNRFLGICQCNLLTTSILVTLSSQVIQFLKI